MLVEVRVDTNGSSTSGRGEFNALDYGNPKASPSNTPEQNKAAIEAAFAACDAAGGGHVIAPASIDYGFNKLDKATRPNVLGTLTNDITFFDYSIGDADGAGNKLGAHTRITYYTKQTDPQGMHDGDAFDISGYWHVHMWLDHIATYAAPNDPSRTTGDNRRARVWFANEGAATWSIGQSTRSGAEFTDEELSNFVIEAYGTSIGDYAPLIIDRATGRWSIGNGTNTPPAQLHVKQASAGTLTGMFDSFGKTCSVALRNSDGAVDDWYLENQDGVFAIYTPNAGTSLSINQASRYVGILTGGSPTCPLHVAGPVRVGQYTTAARPDPVALGAGAMIFCTTTGKPNWSNGVDWLDAAGAIQAY